MGDELEWIKWFPHKYRDEVGLRFCSFAAEGLWMAILMRMHTNDPYGHLTLAGRAPSPKEMAKILGKGTASQIQSGLEELEHERVFSRTSDGIIYCRRMVRDNRRRLIAKENGSHGGNPALLTSLDNQHVPNRITKSDNLDGHGGLTNGLTTSVKTEIEKEKEKEGIVRGESVRGEFSLASPEPDAGKPAPKRQKARKTIDPEWFPTIEATDFAYEHGYKPSDLDALIASFIDHHTGRGNVMADWTAAWRTWVRKSVEFQPRKGH